MCVRVFFWGAPYCQLHCAANHEHVKPTFSSASPSFCKLDVWSIAQWPHKWPQRQERKRVRWSMRQQNPRRRALLQSAAMGVLLPKKSRTIRVCGSLRCVTPQHKNHAFFNHQKRFFRRRGNKFLDVQPQGRHTERPRRHKSSPARR